MKITATIQARMGSSRLPGKVLKKINNKPILEWQINRLKKSLLIDNIIIATSDNKEDQKIIELCKSLDIQYWSGSENDVLGRVHDAFFSNKAAIHAEFYGDSPFIDPTIIDQFLKYFLKEFDNIDYLTNSKTTTFPPGSEFSIYKSECLKYAHDYTDICDPLREHVSLNITNKDKFRTKNIEAFGILNEPNLYLEIDTIKDYEMLSKLIPIVINEFGNDFGLLDIIHTSKKEIELCKLNSTVERRWKKFREGWIFNPN